jgi:SAM-dependent methyltransferase
VAPHPPSRRLDPAKAHSNVSGYSAACERNKGPILEQLSIHLAGLGSVLELGSGTGQHAVYFAAALPHLRWQPSERRAALAGLAERVAREGSANLAAPVELDVAGTPWPPGPFDAIFTANTLHIMGWPEVERCYAGVAQHLAPGAPFICYGPFSRHGRHTSESNERFDRELKARDAASGVRDLDDLEALGRSVGLRLSGEVALPANNQILVWRRTGAAA